MKSLLSAIMMAWFSAQSMAGTAPSVSSVLEYDSRCQAAAAAVKSNDQVNPLDAENLDLDLYELNHQLGLLLNENEDADFRLTVLSVAESTRQSLVYDLKEIAEIDPALAKNVIASCKLSNMHVSINEIFISVVARILDGLDGIDPE